MDKKAAISLALMMIIIAIIGVILIIFYLMIFSPSTLHKIIPQLPTVP